MVITLVVEQATLASSSQVTKYSLMLRCSRVCFGRAGFRAWVWSLALLRPNPNAGSMLIVFWGFPVPTLPLRIDALTFVKMHPRRVKTE